MGDIKWVEVWADAANPGGYLLTLRALKEGTFELKDPQKGGQVIEIFQTYDDATSWFGEEEYDLVGKLDCELREDSNTPEPDSLTR